MKITYKYKRPTDKHLGHTDVFVDDEYIGYMILERNKFRPKGYNWYFVSDSQEYPGMAASSKGKLISLLEEIVYAKIN